MLIENLNRKALSTAYVNGDITYSRNKYDQGEIKKEYETQENPNILLFLQKLFTSVEE